MVGIEEGLGGAIVVVMVRRTGRQKGSRRYREVNWSI